MIKKILLIALLLMILVVPCVFADAANTPIADEGELIKVEYKIADTDIEIDGEIKFSMTITNLTNMSFRMEDIIDYGMTKWIQVGIDLDDRNAKREYIELGAFESIEIEFAEPIIYFSNWYKDGDEFFTDFDPVIHFYMDENNDGIYDWSEIYVQAAQDPIKLRVTNLYDGSDFVEFEWLDDRDIIYYIIGKEWIDHDEYMDTNYATANMNYKYSLKNLSDAEILGVKAGETKTDYSSFYSFVYLDEMGEKETLYFRKIFLIDGKNYAIEYPRTYKTAFLEPPKVDAEIIYTKAEDGDYVDGITVVVTNSYEDEIENLGVDIYTQTEYTYARVFDFGTVKKGESLQVTTDYDFFEQIGIGYLIDGVFYCWDIDCYDFWGEIEEDEHIVLEPVSYDYDFTSSIDIEAWNYRKEQWDLKMSYTPEPTEIVTPMPRVTDAPTPTLEPTSSPISAVTVTKRSNPMLWAFIAIGVLMAGAVVAIVLSIKKIVRDKNSNQSLPRPSTGKALQFASQDNIKEYESQAVEFLKSIFGVNYYNGFYSDSSFLELFNHTQSDDFKKQVINKVQDVYSLDITDIYGKPMWMILKYISENANKQKQ